ncbi:MAG TPA: 16S rRNA (uracil(1498)-N(3))-methyltransferase [Pirellulales bacterium]|nr:16S rRNA (uracil(1498)-N(3))-methyltransferase [Pirellulales bacterium]
MPARYFVETPITGDRAVLAAAEAHHLAHVMRARAGDEVTLFDGSGFDFSARIERIGRSEVELSITSRTAVDHELPIELTLAVALPKGDRQAWLVEKATELGVTRLVPLVTERGVAQPVEKALVRLRRTVIEASKQCGRARLMQVAEPRSIAEIVVAAEATAERIIAHVDGAALPPGARAPGASVIAAVGPEGGWTDAELAIAAEHGWFVTSLGPRTLRVETAAIALAVLIAAS